MPKSKKENIEEMTLDPIEEKVKEPSPVEEPVEEPETVDEGEDITEPDELIEPEEGEQGEDVEFDEDAGEEETDEDAPEESAPPVLGLMLGAKNAPVSEDPDPQSRIEALLWHIINGTTTDAVPQSRNEAILTAIANSGTYTEEAQSRIEALLIAILNHEESDITPISRNEAILKAIANSGEYDEEPQSRNEELLIEWLEAISIVIGTASGAVASFNTSLTEPLVKCECEFSASQASGTPTPATPIPIVGVDKVDVTRAGKNLLPSLSSAVTVNHITFSPLSDGAIDIDGTASGNASVDVGRNEGFFLQAGTYYVNITATPYTITVFGIVNGTVTTIKNGGGLFTLTKPTQIFVRLFIASGTTVNHLRLPLQLELGSTATAYEAYNGVTTTINLGGTYYGGSVDAVTGKITLTHELYNTLGANISNVVKDSSSWRVYYSSAIYGTDNQYKEGLCDKLAFKTSYSGVNGNNNSIGFPASAGTQILIRNDALTTAQEVKDFMATLNVVYPLETPIVVYASNTAEIPTIAGANNCFCDTGDIEVEYKKRRND